MEYFTFDNSEADITTISLAFYSGLFAYNGWNYLNLIIEELKDPVKSVFFSFLGWLEINVQLFP